MKWNLVNEFNEGELIDTIVGPYSIASRKARELEKERDIEITIYQTI